ncbi:MAG: biotin transporter BioY [Deltaproteobacteria bacterium]|nr:biotin transporter BioY [Deltaproteobacteria bacterium]
MSAVQLVFERTRKIAFSKHIGALGFAVLIGLGASWKVSLPFTPVPITGQTLFLLLGAAFLKRYYSLEMVGFYLLFGGLGLPFFAGGVGGWGYFTGATGGYLIGFVLASALLGFGIDRCPKRWQQLLLFFVAAKVIFVPGLLWLKLFLNIDWAKAIALGFTPFVIGDFLKIGLAFSLYSLPSLRVKN